MIYQEAKEKRKENKKHSIVGFIGKSIILVTPALLFIQIQKVDEGNGDSLPYCLSCRL